MHGRVQKGQRVAKHRAAEHCLISGKFLVAVGAQPFAASNLEQRLGLDTTEDSAHIAPREKLKRSKLATRGGAKLGSLPTEAAIGALVVDANTHPTIDEQAGDLGIELEGCSRPEVAAFPNAAIRAKSTVLRHEESTFDILLDRVVGGRTGLDRKERAAIDSEQPAQRERGASAIEVIEVVGAAEECRYRRAPGEWQLEVVGIRERAFGLYSESCSGASSLDPEHSARRALGPRPTASRADGQPRAGAAEIALHGQTSEQSFDSVEAENVSEGARAKAKTSGAWVCTPAFWREVVELAVVDVGARRTEGPLPALVSFLARRRRKGKVVSNASRGFRTVPG